MLLPSGPHSFTHGTDFILEETKQNNNTLVLDGLLVMPGIRDGPVHAELVALQLVELVPGVGVLARPHHRRPDIQVLVEVLPADLTCTHIVY